jgi:predicted PurR-regulated permease PerM
MARSRESEKSSRFLTLAAVCIVVAALYFAREVLIPLSLAVLVSFLLAPVVRWLESLRLSRGLASLIVIVLATGLVGAGGYMVWHQAVSVIEQLPNYHAQLSSKLKGLRGRGSFITTAQKEIKSIAGPETQPATAAATQPASSARPNRSAASAEHPATPPTSQPTAENPLPVRVVSDPPSPITVIENYGSSLLSPLATTGLVLVLVIFMLLDREDLRDRMIRLLGHGRLNLTTQALDETSTRITRYLSRLALVNAGYAILTAAGLWLAGRLFGHGTTFPNVLGWGIIVGLLRFVPYIGIWIGAGLPLLLSFALFPGNGVFFATLAMFLVLEIVVSQFIEPMWYGASTGMTPLAVLVAAVFWTWLWGPVGLLLSTPMTVCLVVIGKHVPQLKFIDILLRDQPVLEPYMRLYQRLIAGDEEEAGELAREQLKEQSLEEVFDKTLMPALAMAVHDRHHGRVDEHRFDLLIDGMRDIVEELSDEEQTAAVTERAAAVADSAKNGTPVPTKRPKSRLSRVPQGCTVNILCLPARDEADEIAALMLARLLDLRGYCATAASRLLAGEMIELVEKQKAQIVCVSAMPPAAVAHARYLCKRLNTAHPDRPTMIALWSMKGDLARARERLSCGKEDNVVTTLANAQDKVEQIAHPMLVSASTT